MYLICLFLSVNGIYLILCSVLTPIEPQGFFSPDSKQSLGQRWVMVGVVGNMSFSLVQHWTKTKVSTVEVLLLAQRWNFNFAPTVDFELWGQCWPKNMFADNRRFIFLNIKLILIMQKLYNLLLGENSVILFYNNNFMI